MKYGRLKIIKQVESVTYKCGQKCKRVLCVCDCGVKKEIMLMSLKNGDTRSCGCLQKELQIKRATIHGMAGTLIYGTWRNIKRRCEDIKDISYHRYGGRGIKVCKRWLDSFENFYEDMGDKPSSEYSIDRINNNGNYCKSNCRWSTKKEQSNNKENNIIVGKNSLTLKQYCEKNNLPYKVVWQRMKRDNLILSEAVKNHSRQTAIIQLTLDKVFIASFVSQKKASRVTGISQGNIHAVLNGKRNYAGGYKWKYTK